MTEIIDEHLKSRRLAIFERVKARLAASGQRVSEDPVFVELVHAWTEGRAELDDVLKGYVKRGVGTPSGLVSEPAHDFPTKNEDAELLADLERVIGMVDLGVPDADGHRYKDEDFTVRR